MICRERSLIFVHIPKCGGTSVEDAIWGPKRKRTVEQLWGGFVSPTHNKYQTGGLNHLTAAFIRQEVGGDTFRRCFKFALVREPLERIISQFRHLHSKEDLQSFAGLGKGFDFDDYLTAIAERQHVQWMPQVDFLHDQAGEELLDRVYRLEDLIKDIQPLNRDAGLDLAALPLKNSSGRKAPRPHIKAAQAERVYEMFREDYEALGYPKPVMHASDDTAPVD